MNRPSISTRTPVGQFDFEFRVFFSLQALLWTEAHDSGTIMSPNRQDAELERLRLSCGVNSIEAVPKAQEVTT